MPQYQRGFSRCGTSPYMAIDRDHDQRLLVLPEITEPAILFQIGKPSPWRLQAFWRASAFQAALGTSAHPLVDCRALPGPAMGILILRIHRNGNIE
jgi:hypothetical protein